MHVSCEVGELTDHEVEFEVGQFGWSTSSWYPTCNVKQPGSVAKGYRHKDTGNDAFKLAKKEKDLKKPKNLQGRVYTCLIQVTAVSHRRPAL